MSLPSPDQMLKIGVGIAAVLVAIVTGRIWSRRRLERWCAQQGYELVEWRGAKFFEGPGAWHRSENQDGYHIEVRDRQGFIRSGYIVFGSYWRPGSRKVRVEWD